MDITFQELKDIATLANLVLIPIVIFLAKINTKLEVLSEWKTDHSKSDNEIHTDLKERLRIVELRQAGEKQQ